MEDDSGPPQGWDDVPEEIRQTQNVIDATVQKVARVSVGIWRENLFRVHAELQERLLPAQDCYLPGVSQAIAKLGSLHDNACRLFWVEWKPNRLGYLPVADAPNRDEARLGELAVSACFSGIYPHAEPLLRGRMWDAATPATAKFPADATVYNLQGWRNEVIAPLRQAVADGRAQAEVAWLEELRTLETAGTVAGSDQLLTVAARVLWHVDPCPGRLPAGYGQTLPVGPWNQGPTSAASAGRGGPLHRAGGVMRRFLEGVADEAGIRRAPGAEAFGQARPSLIPTPPPPASRHRR